MTETNAGNGKSQRRRKQLVTIQICMKEGMGNPEWNTYEVEKGLGYQIYADGPERPPTHYYTVEVPEEAKDKVIAHLTASPYVKAAFVVSSRPVPPKPRKKKMVTIHIVTTPLDPESAAHMIEKYTGFKLWANGPERPPTRNYTTEVEAKKVDEAIAKILECSRAEKAYTI
jgi:hypothetical protein